MPRPSQRDRVLDAYTDLVVETGPGAVTLEAVAGRAGVSKGGLLYHFGSKDALLDGLLSRTEERNRLDLDDARRAPDGVARYYLRTSVSDASDPDARGMHRAMVALYTLSSGEPRAAEATRRCMTAWQDLLTDSLDDPLTAHLLAAVGDGLYLRAIVGDDSGALSRDWDAVLARLGVEPR